MSPLRFEEVIKLPKTALPLQSSPAFPNDLSSAGIEEGELPQIGTPLATGRGAPRELS